MLLNFENVYKSYGDRQLLDGVTFYLNPGDRMGVVGVNGCGKSTLLKLASFTEEPDSGRVSTDPNVRISYLEQSPEFDRAQPVLDYVLSGQPADAREVFEYEAREVLAKLGINDFSQLMGELSGGQRKRASLARCLVSPADLLILDEPTNHLDTQMIEWLEGFIVDFPGAVLFVSHDRYFLEQVAGFTAEVSFGKVYITPGGYSSWLDSKAKREEMQAASERKRQSILRRELIWVLQGPCARGTKSKERLARYAALKSQLPPQTDSQLEEIKAVSSRLGRKTIALSAVTKGYGGRTIIPHFDFILLRDDRVGIVGENGSGKSTLLNLISGRTAPDSGTVETGETVKIGYFSQHGEELDGSMTALEYVCEKGQSIPTADGYISAERLMEDFLFTGTLQHSRIDRLSGGEKRRLFLLGILAQAPNVLLLDEPTNDLDIPTLQILEHYLLSFPGAIVAVSHDRYFLDRVCRRVFVIEPGAEIKQFTGGYTDYREVYSPSPAAKPEKKRPAENSGKAPSPTEKPQKLKMSFKEQREYATIEDDIAALENELNDLSSQQDACSTDYAALTAISQRMQELETLLDEKMDRWEYLNGIAQAIEKGK